MIRLAFVANPKPEAQAARDRLAKRYGATSVDEADVVVALGGDGVMLRTLHGVFARRTPIFGMNMGSVGFLMNEFAEEGLEARIARAKPSLVYPLHMTARTRDGEERTALAFNEVSLLRETRQTAKIRIEVDGVERMPELMCDGVLAATPAGSTAYNLSAHGPILPLKARLIALTPISAFRPRRWRGAILPHDAHIRFDVLDAAHRPVGVSTDMEEIRNVVDVCVREEETGAMTMLFDGDHTLEERIIAEQFRI